jgi:hypothetical protein
MPSKSVKKTTTPPVETVIQNIVTEPVQVLAETPVVEKVAEAEPVKQKGGKKAAKVVPLTEAIPPVVSVESTSTPVTSVESATTPVTSMEAVAKPPSKRGGAKSKAPVEAGAVVEPKPEIKKRARAPKAPVQEGGAVVEEQTAGATKAKAPKKQVVAKKDKTVKAAPVAETENDESSDRRIRSFKVKLPDKEEFEGRFTGLTPYQAANKALSKYFRETEVPKQEITFLICESTRKSKKSVYTYVGKRYQLEVPVKYTIQDGREIVKNFKNSLKKVKKIDLIDQAGDAAAPVAPATA